MKYIITNTYGVQSLCGYTRDGVLVCGDYATVFNDLRTAKKAIERSKIYSEYHEFAWDTEYRILKLESFICAKYKLKKFYERNK